MCVLRPALHVLAVIALAAPASTGSLMSRETPRVIVEAIRDPFVPEDYHWCRSDVRFRLSRAARVTLRASGRAVDGYVDGGELVTVSDVALGAGPHHVSLVGGELADVASIVPFALDAKGAGGHVETAAGILEGDLSNPPVLVVGRTFVRGVDLLDGHVVGQATDYETGKGPIGLRVTRTYTSAGRGAAGLVGAGWSFSWQLTLTRHADLFVVRLSDGNGLVFRRRKDGTFEPPPGYHSRLVSNPDGSFDFYDLAGYRYRFERPLDPRDPLGKLRLEVIVSPEAGRALLRYDAAGRLAGVSEETPEGREVWCLDFGYTRAGGFERLAWARDRKGRVRVRYAYDSFGNLVGVTRSGPKGEAVLWRYAYSVDDVRDRHQLVEAEGGGGKTSYAYYRDGDAFEGEGPREIGLLLFGKGECVREVKYSEGAAAAELARYVYDYSGWKGGVFRTRVGWVDARGEGETLYVLNAGGTAVEIREQPSAPAKVPAAPPARGRSEERTGLALNRPGSYRPLVTLLVSPSLP